MESIGSTVYQEQIKIQDGGVSKPSTPLSVMDIGRSNLYTKHSEADQRESNGTKSKQSNADLLLELPDQITRNENKTHTEDTNGKKFRDEDKIEAGIQLLDKSASEMELNEDLAQLTEGISQKEDHVSVD